MGEWSKGGFVKMWKTEYNFYLIMFYFLLVYAKVPSQCEQNSGV